MKIVTNGRLLTKDIAHPYYEQGAVVFAGDKIIAAGDGAELRHAYPDAEPIDARGGLIMPALINTHNHIYSALARGMAIKGYAPRGFLDILSGLWWNLDAHLHNEHNRISARLTAIDCIKNGVTTIFDHHASYGEINDSLFVIGGEISAAGLRSCLCYEVSDRAGKDKARLAVAENSAYIADCARDNTGMRAAMMGLHASFTLSDETLDLAVNSANGAGCHIHVAEGIEDEQQSLMEYGMRVVARLRRHGVLGSRTIAAHGVHIDASELMTLRDTDTVVVHNPESNMGNAVGCPPVMRMLAQGILCGLGTDGYTNDMFESFKAANLLHKHALGDCNAAWAEAPQMLFDNNPLIAARFFPQRLGVLEPGASADLIVVAYDPITPLDAENANSHLLFGVNGAMVQTTICAGRVLMQDRRLSFMDEEATAAHAREAAAELASRINA